MKKTICILVGLLCCGIFSSGFNSYVWDALRQQLDAYGRFVQVRFADGTNLTSASGVGGNYMLVDDYDSNPANGVADMADKLAGNVYTPSSPASVTWRAQQGFYIDGGYNTATPYYVYLMDGIVTNISPSALTYGFVFCDFFTANGSNVDPYLGNGSSSGTISASVTDSKVVANHPGVVVLRSSTSANSGYQVRGQTAGLRLGGGEYAIFIINLDVSNCTVYLGFHDTQDQTDPTDGVYVKITESGGNPTAVAWTANNSVRSSSSSYTMAIDTWYRVMVPLSTDASTATYTIYNEAGTVLWTTTIATNIPTAEGRNVTPSLVATELNTDVTASNILHVDFMGNGSTRTLVR